MPSPYYTAPIGLRLEGYSKEDRWEWMYGELLSIYRAIQAKYAGIETQEAVESEGRCQHIMSVLHRVTDLRDQFEAGHIDPHDSIYEWPNSLACKNGTNRMTVLLREFAGPYCYFGGHNSKGGNKYLGFWIDIELLQEASKEGRIISLKHNMIAAYGDYKDPTINSDWWPSDEIQDRIEADVCPEYVYVTDGMGCHWLFTPTVRFHNSTRVWRYIG